MAYLSVTNPLALLKRGAVLDLVLMTKETAGAKARIYFSYKPRPKRNSGLSKREKIES